MPDSLPIDPLLPELVAHLKRENCLVLEAPPGAGKTTRVPPAIYQAAFLEKDNILVLEPRRLAARLAARRVAEEMQERLGETVGYQVRFDEVSSARTRIRFITEGVLTRRLLSDPELGNVGAVLLDEFHERHLQADIALALLRRLQQTRRPDLRIVVMSATLATANIAQYLGDCRVMSATGRKYDVKIDHQLRTDERPLETQVSAAVKELIATGHQGDILVFLPGAAEIRRAREACEKLGDNLLVVALHGDLPAAEQDRAVKPADRQKVILSTNVAESSVTIEGVTAVIDSGLARVASYSPWSGLPALKIERVSRASATQRAGRAGRTAPGRCLRLYTKQDFDARPEHDTAEIHRADLAETVLELRSAGINDLTTFNWYERPPQSAITAATELLISLGALDEQGITELGRRLLRFPLHPRLSRMIIEAEARGFTEAGCLLAALVSERDIRLGARSTGLTSNARGALAAASGPSDLLVLYDLFKESAAKNFSPERMRAMGLDIGALTNVERVRKQLIQISGRNRSEKAGSDLESALLISALAAYPDRVARCRPGAASRIELVFAGGGSAQLSENSVVRSAEYVIAIDAEQRQASGASGGRNLVTIVRLASRIEPDWLLDLFIDQIKETSEVVWNSQVERVEFTRRMLYNQLVIDETRVPASGTEEAAAVLKEAALSKGTRAFGRGDELDRYIARLSFVAATFPEAKFPDLSGDHIEEVLNKALAQLCIGRSSFAELRAAVKEGGLLYELQQLLTPEQRRLVQTMAPEKITLPGGRQARIEYEPGKPPWLASRLQDFFGMAASPVIAGGRVPLVLHLLAPNQRPVQVTTDLASFWSRAYQEVRKELSRRYPRHSWPEDPRTASPPQSRKN